VTDFNAYDRLMLSLSGTKEASILVGKSGKVSQRWCPWVYHEEKVAK
jgi:hypothetical protein